MEVKGEVNIQVESWDQFAELKEGEGNGYLCRRGGRGEGGVMHYGACYGSVELRRNK